METERAIQNGLALLTASLGREVDAFQVKAYLRGLKDVPADVIASAADRLIDELAAAPRGERYFPTVPDWKAACCDIVDEQRAYAAREALQVQDRCLMCRDSRGWRAITVNGVAKVERCDCWQRASAIMARAIPELTRPALPAHEPEPAA